MPTKSESTDNIWLWCFGTKECNSHFVKQLLCESGWALFLSLMERLCIIQLNIFAQRGRPKSHCSKGTFPLLFQQHYVIAHGTGSADSLLILCSQRTDQGDPRFSSSWPVSSMVQMKILTLTPGWSPAHVCSPLSLSLTGALWYPSCLLLSQKALLFSTPAMYRLDFSAEKCKGRPGTQLPLLRQSRRKMVATPAQKTNDFHSGFP